MAGPASARRMTKSNPMGLYLIQPKFPASYWGLEHFMELTPFDAVFPPLGLLTLAALTPPEFQVTLCDENAGDEVDFETDAQMIGITGYVIQDRRVFELADRFRALGKTVILGGPIANLIPELCRPHCDILFEGEAEYIWPRFLQEYKEGKSGDHYHELEKIHLPDSPMPRLDVLNRKYAHGIVQCTRGCPFTCEFCDIIVMYGRKMRYKPVEQVLAEVEAWHRKGALQVFFADDNFVGNRPYAKEILQALADWNNKQTRPLSFYTQCSVDMARDDELLGLLRDANFISVFLGIESPRKSSLAETKKLQNERIDLVGAIHKIQSYNLFISAGMIVGFDSDDVAIFDEQYEFLQAAQIPIVMSSVLLAVPRTPLHTRLKAEGRLLQGVDGTDFVGTVGGSNFHPLRMTLEQLTEGQARLYQKLYAPEAFAHRLFGNLSRMSNVQFKPEPLQARSLWILAKMAARYWKQGPSARKFFFGNIWKAIRQCHRMAGQVIIYMGMYQHFCKVHGKKLDWNPWTAAPIETCTPSGEATLAPAAPEKTRAVKAIPARTMSAKKALVG